MAGKKQNLAPVWKKLMEDVDTVYSWCTQRECKPNEKIFEHTTRSLNLVFLLEQPKNYQDGTNLAQKLQRGPATWKDMLENAWNSIANRRTRIQSNHTRIPVLVWTITKLKWKSWRTKVNCQKFAPILYSNA